MERSDTRGRLSEFGLNLIYRDYRTKRSNAFFGSADGLAELVEGIVLFPELLQKGLKGRLGRKIIDGHVAAAGFEIAIHLGAHEGFALAEELHPITFGAINLFKLVLAAGLGLEFPDADVNIFWCRHQVLLFRLYC